jgi:hypothetical protein
MITLPQFRASFRKELQRAVQAMDKLCLVLRFGSHSTESENVIPGFGFVTASTY